MSYPSEEVKSTEPTVRASTESQYSPVPGADGQHHRWGIHWHTPTFMIGTFVLAIALAIVHDAFYMVLIDNDAIYQRWFILAGTGIAFLVKTLLAACVGVSHRQRR